MTLSRNSQNFSIPTFYMVFAGIFGLIILTMMSNYYDDEVEFELEDINYM